MARAEDRGVARRISDEELEYYGELYLQQGLGEVVDFETFLLDPERYLQHRRSEGARDSGRKGLLGLFRTRPVPGSNQA